ncbi:MAG: glycoside hydrolase family 3 N-terminal domain-containing protein [Desulforhabdus sp.]|nr:glycoside hydrolase family 3 N-terminal domain-containing protein [Desulforhabdus sp.]
MPGKAESNSLAGIHLLVGFRGLGIAEELKSIIKDFRIGGIVLFKRNIESCEQLLNLLQEAQAYARAILGRPLWVAIDQEGGPVQRLIPPFTRLPSAHDLAAQGTQALIQWCTMAALDLRRCGIQINFAPVLDVLPEGESHFMRERSLGSDPLRVAELGALWIDILQRNGISATAKHYPGLGLAPSDPHHFAPVIDWANQNAMERALLPFREAIKAGVHGIMTSHACYPLLDTEWPATLSPSINREWLRNRLHFDGVLFSDDLDMAAVSGNYAWQEIVRQGIHSTLDFFLLCQVPENIEHLYEALRNTLDTDSSLSDLHQQSLRRIEKLFRQHDVNLQLE